MTARRAERSRAALLLAALTAPGVAQRLSGIRGGTDPDYQKLADEQALDDNDGPSAAQSEQRQVEAAQAAQQAVRDGNQIIGGAGIGDLVCSKLGVYHTKYVAYVEGRNADRVLVKIVGGYRNGGEFHSQEMHWDDIQNWTPCTAR